MLEFGVRAGGRRACLLCRAGRAVLALPIESVGETLRPLPIVALSPTTDVVLGVSIVRGHSTPVVDGRALMGELPDRPPGRLVTLRLGARVAALAVDEVIGVRALEDLSTEELPPLLGEVAADLASAIAVLDGELLVVLRASRVVPSAVWQAMEARA